MTAAVFFPFLSSTASLTVTAIVVFGLAFWFLSNLTVSLAFVDRRLARSLLASFEYLYLVGNALLFSIAGLYTDLYLLNTYLADVHPNWHLRDDPAARSLAASVAVVVRVWPMVLYLTGLSIDAFPIAPRSVRLAFAFCLLVFPAFELYVNKTAKASYTSQLPVISEFMFQTDTLQLSCVAATNLCIFSIKTLFRALFYPERLQLIAVTYNVSRSSVSHGTVDDGVDGVQHGYIDLEVKPQT